MSDDDEPITLEWLSEVAPRMLNVEDDKPGGYATKRGIEVGGPSCCYIMCGKRRVDKKWVPTPEIELHYVVPADYNYEGNTCLDHIETRDQFRQLVLLLTGNQL